MFHLLSKFESTNLADSNFEKMLKDLRAGIVHVFHR